MAILTIDEYKALPAYNSSQSDDIIEALIPEVEAHFEQLRGAAFTTIRGSIADGAKVITGVVGIVYRDGVDQNRFDLADLEDCVAILRKKQVVYLEDVVRGLIVSWDTESDTITIDTAADDDASDAIFTIYPAGSKLIASRMIKYLIENDGEKSYSIGDESIQYDEFLGIYPKSIVQGIERYVVAQ